MSKDLDTTKSNSKKIVRNKKTLLLLSMVAPGAIWLILLRYLPMFGIVIAFKEYKIYTKAPSLINNIIHSDWVGLSKFKFIFATSDSWKMIRNTLGYNALWIILGLVISVSFAIMLSEITNKFVAKTYQTLMFFPYFLSWVVASYFVLAFLDPTRGLLVNIQKDLGMEATNWYNNPKPWPVILTIASLWKSIGYSSILYLAAITGIDAAQYEAASIDGASKWQQIRFVTIPHLKSMIIILFILNIGKIFNADFGLFWNIPMNSGPLFPATQVIDTYVYRVLTATSDIGMSTAAGLLQNLIGFICIMTANTIVRKYDEDSSLF
ncbi:MAG: binding-protein-dependent transport system inner rane component [Anaerocolumna sp.]|jgi:putative aldouronate transport system permease protein|nr:binding-protein-dependent transport system inner rane component [Anaerocolumna sp.]